MVSALSEKTAQPFSAFKTPYVNTSKWNGIDKLGDMYGAFNFSNESNPGYEDFAEKGICDTYENHYDPYPAWSADSAPITKDRIQSIFIHISKIFGFQYDNTKNMFDYLLKMLDSRASRMGPAKALRSVHADYIGGYNSNYRKWYFGSQMDVEDFIMSTNPSYMKLSAKERRKLVMNQQYSIKDSEINWTETTNSFLAEDCIIQLAIYLLIWGEANNIRFMPECLCFIFRSCVDCFYSLDFTSEMTPLTASFLDHAITPLYDFYRDQLYSRIDDHWVINEKDHEDVIGYDDINQTFWYRNGLDKIELYDKHKIMDISPRERYLYLNQINWKKSVCKTYYESRSWFHVIINFNRVWNIHLGVFWYYTCLNCPSLYTERYLITADNQPPLLATLSALSIAGSIVSFVNLISLILEGVFVPRSFAGALPLFPRLIMVCTCAMLTTAPTIYIFHIVGPTDSSPLSYGIAVSQFILSLLVVFYFSVVPLSCLTGSNHSSSKRNYLPSYYFTNFIHNLKGKKSLASMGLWGGVFVSKFTESYFFLTLSLRDPVRELSVININRCLGEAWFGSALCMHEAQIILGLLFFTDLILFFLDTYLWYIVWNTAFSVARSFYCGVSIWTPWRNMFFRLPNRILSKVLNPATVGKHSEKERKTMVLKVWNSIVISMYRDHFISVDQLENLIYQSTLSETGEKIISEPNFFIQHEDGDAVSARNNYLRSDSEAVRRLSFFAHSLSTSIEMAMPLEQMPSFSVLIPHYSEKITLSLQEVIRREDDFSNITLLEYLKHLYPDEWMNFVRDTKMLASEHFPTEDKMEMCDVPFFAVGFKAATPEYVLRTRIWASLRSQTLFRTISGFMNYSRAIKLLYSAECDDPAVSAVTNMEEANVMAHRKFRIVASLQRMKEFSEEQEKAKEFLLRTYPELQIAYLDVDRDPDTNEFIYYSSLIDGNSDILSDGQRKPKYRIRLSGKPILGDGKSDNQNHAIIFCRGEYVQLVDANQDNYLEECLKIRSVLNEFEEYESPEDPYTYDPNDLSVSVDHIYPVAILGTREYIFSENIGVLGDLAAGKEQTFGTLFARTLAQVGGKLHYGHPDFLNTIFMCTRGGVSKSQRGLHLNEDIYAGMNAMMRGGRIKHCEYFQCGKGRDLGFCSILNFTTKIGSGMSEQMLSREYFYLGTQLPLDRFLSFFYAHPGFHLNNVFILLSLKMFLLFCIHLGALTNDSVICSYNRNIPFTDARTPTGCTNLIPIIDWVQRCVLSIFIVFGISFLPLMIQELMERGLWRCIYRISRHFSSLSPMFEVFVCRIYSQSLVNDLAIGGARYIATGRGFSTTRTSFASLYSKFSYESFYFAGTLFLLLLYISLVMWKFSLIYFWATVCSLFFSPFWFNPNAFNITEFFLDYRNFLLWLSSGNVRSKKDSWISHVRATRMSVTGSKIKKAKNDTTFMGSNYQRPSFTSSFIAQIGSKCITTIVISIAFLFANSQNMSGGTVPSNSLLRLLVVSFGPIVANAVVLLGLFSVSLTLGPLMMCCSNSFPGMIANFAHMISVFVYLFTFVFLMLCQNWDVARTILGACASYNIQELFFKLVTILILNKEIKDEKSNRAWWTGSWLNSGLGWHIMTQPFREFVCKIIEMSYFAMDFLISHFILLCQVPILFIPYIDTMHSMLLLWLKPDNMLKKPIYSTGRRRQRMRITVTYLIVFAINIAMVCSVVAVPVIMNKAFDVDFDNYMPDFILALFQPVESINKRKGLQNYIPKKIHG